MERGNVLVLGNPGVGKTTLIEAVMGEEAEVTTYGKEGTPKELAIYEEENAPFRIIEAVGYEDSFLKEQQALGSVKKWSKETLKEGDTDNEMSVIWLCVDATDSKSLAKNVEELVKSSAAWKGVPVIVVITKSYAEPEREKNIETAYVSFARQKKQFENYRKIIPVVAATYMLNENAFAPAEGISELIEATVELIPEGMKTAENKLDNFKLNQKRALAHGIAVAATTAAAGVGFVPIPIPDAGILAVIESKMITSIANIYGIANNEESEPFFNMLLETGTVGLAAQAAIKALKAVPVLNVKAGVINAIAAGGIVFSLGEGTIYAFEQINSGKRSTEDLNWLKEVIEKNVTPELVAKLENIVVKVSDKDGPKEIANIILKEFAGGKNKKNTKKTKELPVTE